MPDEVAKHDLPDALQDIDISSFAGVEPRDLILNPIQARADRLAAGRAIVYARSGDQTSYDAIGFRTFAAAPRKGPAPLQTSAWSAMQRQMTDHGKSNTTVDEILTQQTKLRHRPLALPRDGDYRYTIDSDVIHLYRRYTGPGHREVEDRWIFSLTDPPDALLMGASSRDEPLIAAQKLRIELQGTHWLPFPVLLAEGCFQRLQDIRSRLVRDTRPGAFYCFLSHRWLTPSHPDPDSLQAQFAAWQLFAYLTEAVRVAHQRGLHQPRRFSPQLGQPVGPRGSELAESLIVNVLRFSLDADTLRQAAAEALAFESMLQDRGVARASTDAGLTELNRLLAECPTLRTLTDRIYVWYDYSCIPQPIREGPDTALFLKGLEELVVAQMIGRTAIMLDDADDYLARAWCTLEALVADTHGGATDLIVGSARPSATDGDVEFHFETLLEDRPHVVWRGILDTEVFGVQSSATCMRRLGLAVSDPNDLSFIYKRLSTLTAPAKTHIDDSAIVTGAMPVPSFENGTVGVRARRSGRAFVPNATPAPTTTLDWTDALSVLRAWHPRLDSAAAVLPFRDVSGGAPVEGRSCHVGVVGACEGEAILLANWVYRHRAELESLLSMSVTGISWVASDIAPVGHFAAGTLEALPVSADTWVVVATSTRLQHCPVTGAITESLKWAGVSHATMAIDQPGENVTIPGPAEPPDGVDLEELIVAINFAEHPPAKHPGGLYQWQVQGGLL